MASILVIDDDEQILIMLKKMLELAGYEVTTANNGIKGLQLFRQKQTDLVITDIIMPDKEGIETIGDLKKEFPDVKIIAVSGGGINEAEHYLDIASDFGAEMTFAKPIDSKNFLEGVKKILLH